MNREDTNPVVDRLAVVLDEHRRLREALDAAEIDALAGAIIDARSVFFSGQGRSGLMTRALAIRLMHLGVKVHVAGEPSTPAIGAQDLLIAVSASAGTKATLEHVRIARSSGARVALVSSKKPEPDVADLGLTLPACLAVPTVQHAGSLFEQAFLLVGDALAWHIQTQLGVDERLMNERHANLQ